MSRIELVLAMTEIDRPNATVRPTVSEDAQREIHTVG